MRRSFAVAGILAFALCCMVTTKAAAQYFPTQQPHIVRCESENGKKRYCQYDTRGGVQLSRQLSGSACIQGSTWGFDRQGIWVDRGCRAEFKLIRYTGGLGGIGGGTGGTITCSSNGGYTQCPADTRRGVRMVRQISGSSCTRGNSWGYNPGNIWVNHGCRAEFALGGWGGGGSNNSIGKQEITCSSDTGGRQYCQTGPHRNINLKQQISGSACVAGQTWGEDANGVWVDRGCRAIFRVQY